MATTATFDTYLSVGIREDLTDVIYNIAPSDTPFVSNVDSGSAKGTYHEWQTDSLAAVADSPVAEGADAVAAAVTPTVRLGNYCQINEKTFVISGSDMVADNAGRGVELAYQEAKKGLELRKDIEYRCVGVSSAKVAGAGNAGGSPVAREAATLYSWIYDNLSLGATGTAPTGDGSDVVSEGTPRAFTEAMLESVLDSCYLNGANPDTIMANTTQKRVISSSFTGRATAIEGSHMDKKIVNAVDFYESDYGVLAIVPNRYMAQTNVFVLDTDMWSINYYRPFKTEELAKTGDNIKKQMIVEWTLVAREPLANGAVYALS